MRHHLSNLRADCRGNFAIEFALALPILLLLLVGLLDLGRLSIEKSALLQGAREGAQYGIQAPTDTANIQTTAQNATGISGATATSSTFCECVSGTQVACTTTCSGGAAIKQYVVVTTSAPFRSVLAPATTTFGLNGSNGWVGSWTPPTSVSATITMIVP
ncbi:MAG TPA: TadE/TadG family type IV pilus assembly protein [Reyranella sp.]|nr:TadE/TadG family type IV pilus assembly protein [Reyranella sp.]